jgi:hypothetical protein
VSKTTSQRVFLLLLCVVASTRAQAAAIDDGTAFANSIAPTAPGQLVNPATVNPSAWSSTTTPTTAPAQLGAFSTPNTSNNIYNSAISTSIGALGVQTQNECASYAPGTDPLMDQKCAAVNFMSNNCLPRTTTQQQVIGTNPVTTAGVNNCSGTYGEGASKFDYSNLITKTDPAFTNVNNAQTSAGATVCMPQTIVTTPAKNALSTCITAASTSQLGCSQSLNATVITTYQTAKPTNNCPGGVMVGNYCQASSTGEPLKVYVCPAGYTLDGTTCVGPATINASIATYPSNYDAPSTPLGLYDVIGLNGIDLTFQCTNGVPTVTAHVNPANQIHGGQCNSTYPDVTMALNGTTSFTGLASHNYDWTDQTYVALSYNQTTSTITTNWSGACKQPSRFNACPDDSLYYTTAGTLGRGGSAGRCLPKAGGISLATGGGRAGFTCPAGYTAASGALLPFASYGGTARTWCVKGTVISTTASTSTNPKPVPSKNLTCSPPPPPPNTTATVNSYSCPSGGTVSGSNCVITADAVSRISYSCTSGLSSTGTGCTATTTTTIPATPVYACSSGYTLSGSICLGTPANQIATISGYSCPSGATLSGTNCITVTTAPAPVPYSCADGSAPMNDVCILKSVQTAWSDTCAPYEASAGTTLTTP